MRRPHSRAPHWPKSFASIITAWRRAGHPEGANMSKPTATMSVRQVSDQASVIDIGGEVTAGAENALMDAYTQASTSRTKAIILNFSGLQYMNSSGIGLLVTLLIRVNR